jgi:hypothetical protein
VERIYIYREYLGVYRKRQEFPTINYKFLSDKSEYSRTRNSPKSDKTPDKKIEKKRLILYSSEKAARCFLIFSLIILVDSRSPKSRRYLRINRRYLYNRAALASVFLILPLSFFLAANYFWISVSLGAKLQRRLYR